jgi:hypothetical protein
MSLIKKSKERSLASFNLTLAYIAKTWTVLPVVKMSASNALRR